MAIQRYSRSPKAVFVMADGAYLCRDCGRNESQVKHCRRYDDNDNPIIPCPDDRQWTIVGSQTLGLNEIDYCSHCGSELERSRKKSS